MKGKNTQATPHVLCIMAILLSRNNGIIDGSKGIYQVSDIYGLEQSVNQIIMSLKTHD